MRYLLRTSILASLVSIVFVLQQLAPRLDAQTTDPKVQPDTGKGGDNKDSSPKKLPLDKFSVPPGGVVVLVEEGKDLRGFFPSMILYSPEQHQALMDRIAQLEKKVNGDRKTPHACKLQSTVVGDMVRLTAELHFHVEQPRTIVLAGFRGAQLSAAKIRPQGSNAAWQPAIVDLGTDGYQVQVDLPGDYVVIVESRVALAGNAPGTPAPGTERSFELTLPGAAVTTLSLELPEAVKELRWNKNNVEKPVSPAMESKTWDVALGKVTQLHMMWKEPLAPGGTTPWRTVHGQISVRVDETQAVTVAELTLTDLRGKAKEWRLWLPASSKVKVITPDGVTQNPVKQNPFLHVLTTAAPTSEPLKVAITQTLLRGSNAKIPVGPFSVQDAVRQEGTIEVKLPPEARRGLRLTINKADSVDEREPPRDQPGSDVVAVYKYVGMPAPPKSGKEWAKLAAPLEIERHIIQGKVETHVEHKLRLHQDDRGWQILATCKIVARPLDAPVDYLDVQLPKLPGEALPAVIEPSAAGFPGALAWSAWGLASQLALDGDWVLASPSAAVELEYPDAEAKYQRRVRVKWSKAQSTEFTITLIGSYNVPAGIQKVRLELPRPVAINDRGAKGHMEVSETLELLAQEGGPEVPVPQKHVITRNWERAPNSWDLAWRGHRPEFPIHITTDIEFRLRYAQVKQQLAWDQADRPRGATLLRLRVPAEAKGLKVTGGGKLAALDRDKHLASVDTEEVGGKGRVTLEYDFALPPPSALNTADGGQNGNDQGQIRVPLIWPDQASSVDSKVRLWSLPGTQPVVAESSLAELTWKDAGTEVVAGQDALPVRVLMSEGQDVSLKLRLQPAVVKLPSVVIDRVLVQAVVNVEGTEDYRVRFLLTKLHTASLDLRMPAPLASIAPQILLDGKAITWQTRDTEGLIARVNVDPGLYGKSVVLEVSYQMPRSQAHSEKTGLTGVWQIAFHPPLLEGDVFLGKVRWEVVLPPSMLAVAARGDVTAEQSWQWRGWLPTLEPAISTSDLEQWLTGHSQAESPAGASLVCLSSSLEPLRVFRVNRALWFLVCSGIVLTFGLALCLHRPSAVGWLAVLSLVLCVLAAISWWWPAMLAALLYGAAPGLLVTAMLFLSQWLLHERYKRQLVFLPGFTRVKDGSSLIRSNSTPRVLEPSTIDAPQALGRGST
jgi:hypothetical protein